MSEPTTSKQSGLLYCMEMIEDTSNSLTNHCTNLTSSLEKLRLQQNGTDVELKCKDGSVHAHKNVLISSCEYFEAMFTANLKEKKIGTATFDLYRKKTMDIIVEYLYTGQVIRQKFTEDDFELLVELLNVSQLMLLRNLFRSVWGTLWNNFLSVKNFNLLWKIGTKFDLLPANGVRVEFVKDGLEDRMCISEKSELPGVAFVLKKA